MSSLQLGVEKARFNHQQEHHHCVYSPWREPVYLIASLEQGVGGWSNPVMPGIMPMTLRPPPWKPHLTRHCFLQGHGRSPEDLFPFLRQIIFNSYWEEQVPHYLPRTHYVAYPQTTHPPFITTTVHVRELDCGQWLTKDTRHTYLGHNAESPTFYLSMPSTGLYSKQNKKIHPVNQGRASRLLLPPRKILSLSLQTQNWFRPVCLSVSVDKLRKTTLLR